MNIEELLNNKENQPDWFNYWDLNEIKEHLEEILNNPQATKTDEISEGDGEFGLVKSNPIPVYGIPEGKVYLNKLTFENGDPLTYLRIGSFRAANIRGIIDAYSLRNQENEEKAIIYICPYHLKTSRKSPKGFLVGK
jgi:hypothetical protein